MRPTSLSLLALLWIACGAPATQPPRRAPRAEAPPVVPRPTAPEPPAIIAAPISPAERLAEVLRPGGSVTWREGPVCVEWDVDAVRSRSDTATLVREESRIDRSYRARVEAATLVVHAPVIGRARGVCRTELHAQSADARGVAMERGWIYVDRSQCVQGLADGHEPLDLGACDGMFELLTTSSPADAAGEDPIERVLAHRGSIHWLAEVESALECQRWTAERRGRAVSLVHVVPTGRATYRVLAHVAGRLEVSGEWQGNDGSMMGMGNIDVLPVHYPSPTLAMAGGHAWFLREEDCEAARAAGSAAAWLRATTE